LLSMRGFLANNKECKTAERTQPRLMYFTTNQKNKKEMKQQADALRKTIDYFERN